MKETWKDEFYYIRSRIDMVPPDNRIQDYIDLYLSTGDEKYLTWFLYNYEKQLNVRIMGIVQRYGMVGHFLDLKMVYVDAIYMATRKYDPSRGVPFLKFKEYFCMNQLHEYMRVMLPGYTVPSEHEYRQLRYIMRLYNENGRKNDEESIRKIADKLNVSERLVIDVLMGGVRNERKSNLFIQYGEDTVDETKISSDVTFDNAMNPERNMILTIRRKDVMRAFEKLRPKDRNVLAERLGFCEKCYSLKEKADLEDIRKEQGYYSISAVDSRFHAAVGRLRKKLEDFGYLLPGQEVYEDDDSWELNNSI